MTAKMMTLVVGPVTRTAQSGTEEVDLLTADPAMTRHMEPTARPEFARRAKQEPVIWPTVQVAWGKRVLTISAQVAQ